VEKVKLTKEQAEGIQKLYTFIHDNDVLNLEFTARELSEIIKYGYEVEETFEVGDWVVYDNGVERGYGYKTNQIKDVDEQKAYFDERRSMNLSSLRHATPEEIAEEKQRRWWESNNRAVWELKEGDILKDIYQREIHEVVGIGFMGSVMFEGDTSYRAVDEIENKCTVVCLAEDRKDINQ